MHATASHASATAPFDEMRAAMVESQLRPNAVSDTRVVAAMARVAREDFLPAELAPVAYADARLPIAAGRTTNLPVATGRLLTQAALQPSDHALIIGAAGGYVAAVLAGLVASVVAVECDAALAAQARGALGGFANVSLVEAPLASGHAAGAPYDVIIVDGAIEQVPQALIDQLAVGGRLVGGVIDRGICRLSLGRRTSGGFGMVDFADFDAAPLPGFAIERGFVF